MSTSGPNITASKFNHWGLEMLRSIIRSRRSFLSLISISTFLLFIAQTLRNSKAENNTENNIVADNADTVIDIQAQIDALSALGGGVVRIGRGKFRCRGFVLRDSVVVSGEGRSATTLEIISSDRFAAISIASGPIRYSGLRDITIKNEITDKETQSKTWALSIVAVGDDSVKHHGGLWWSQLERVEFFGFSKGISVVGGGALFLTPNQFVSFVNCNVILSKDAIGPALELVGQVGQFEFRNCLFDVIGGLGDCAIVLKSSDPDVMPMQIHFELCTVQSHNKGIDIQNAHNVTFSNCWFENLGRSATVKNNSRSIAFSNCRFANSGSSGYALYFEGYTKGTVSGCLFAGPRTLHTVLVSPGSDVGVLNNDVIWGAQL